MQGVGLGKNLEGISEIIRTSKKEDNGGVGLSLFSPPFVFYSPSSVLCSLAFALFLLLYVLRSLLAASCLMLAAIS
jgi:hypothetical protein